MARIAIFDSGVGGLTVAKAIHERLPGVRLRYLGDTARLPYGTKSARTVIRYALQAAAVLLQEDADALVVACNTASSCALPALRERFGLPVIGVVEPGARRAVELTKSDHIGVIGTERTVASGAYDGAIAARRPEVAVHSCATPVLVGLAEEGWFDHPVTEAALRTYLQPWIDEQRAQIDTLVLGCTHYPALKPAIGKVAAELWSHPVQLVDSADTIADALLERFGTPEGPGDVELLATDELDRFSRVGQRFFDLDQASMRSVDL